MENKSYILNFIHWIWIWNWFYTYALTAHAHQNRVRTMFIVIEMNSNRNYRNRWMKMQTMRDELKDSKSRLFYLNGKSRLRYFSYQIHGNHRFLP